MSSSAINLTIFGASVLAKNNGRQDIVHLTETAAVLEILFQFGYSTRHPVLDNLEFDKLLTVADAAEKYHFYSAAPMCQMALRNNISKHPLEVFRFAIKHDYPDDFVDEVAAVLRPVPVSSPTDPRLHPSVAPAWIIYQEAWRNIFKRACVQEKTRTLAFFDPQIPPETHMADSDPPDFVNVECVHPCKRCYFTILSWCTQLAEGEPWVVKNPNNHWKRMTLPSYVSSALALCPCPPPFQRELSEASLKNGKEDQNDAVIHDIVLQCWKAIREMGSFSFFKKTLIS
ncbi:hypothetical protein CPC08DRAFT_756397 [Agrocybe pediades]|nr:hypothetical protein CPC08DRAFT_756397 [Agrocybe pediades]